jgi:hypothetical protein
MEKRMLMMNGIIKGVKFVNLPILVTEEGQIRYPLNAFAIAEEIADGIAEHVKPYVSVDFTSVDRQAVLQRITGNETKNYSPNDDPEKQLLDYIYGDAEQD